MIESFESWVTSLSRTLVDFNQNVRHGIRGGEKYLIKAVQDFELAVQEMNSADEARLLQSVAIQIDNIFEYASNTTSLDGEWEVAFKIAFRAYGKKAHTFSSNPTLKEDAESVKTLKKEIAEHRSKKSGEIEEKTSPRGLEAKEETDHESTKAEDTTESSEDDVETKKSKSTSSLYASFKGFNPLSPKSVLPKKEESSEKTKVNEERPRKREEINLEANAKFWSNLAGKPQEKIPRSVGRQKKW